MDVEILDRVEQKAERPIRIAVIDDDRDFLELAREWLDAFEEARFEVAYFHDPMDIYDPHHLKPFDVYVVDFGLGMMDGVDLINALRGKIHPGPFILCSGVLSPQQRERAAKSKIEMVVEKDGMRGPLFGRIILEARKIEPSIRLPLST